MKKVKLTRGKYALVDDEDFEKVSQFNWYTLKGGYAVRDIRCNKKRTCIYMHRFILDAPKGMVVDHINRKKHDNRRKNLRLVTQVENAWNSKRRKDNKSGHRGVSWDKAKGKWGVRLKVGKLYKFGGYFTNKKKAAERYKELVAMYRDNHASV